jgi:DNA polymerase III beta subunit, C-terminal domain
MKRRNNPAKPEAIGIKAMTTNQILGVTLSAHAFLNMPETFSADPAKPSRSRGDFARSGAGTASRSIPAQWSHAPDFMIGFNARYLLDILSKINGENFTAIISDCGSPILFEDGNTLFVLMPMRV